jgi:transcriptional regulator with XRE-family HTH domain
MVKGAGSGGISMANPETYGDKVLATAEDIPSVLKQLRLAKGLSQRELARKAHTQPSVICRLEKPSYRGHSLEMLQRIGSILGLEIAVQFVSRECWRADSGAEDADTGRP